MSAEDSIARLEAWRDELAAEALRLAQRVDELGEVQLANREGMSSYQRVTTARIEQIEEHLARLERVREQRYAEVKDFLTGTTQMRRQRHEAIRDQGMIVGSFVWAVMQLRHGVHVRRRAWRDEASSVQSLRDLMRELDIAPDADLIALDWEAAPGFVPYPREVA